MATASVPNYDLNRVYKIKGGQELGFVPGRVGTGEQVLMGVLREEALVAFFFSPAGELLRHEFFPVPYDPDPNLLPGQQNSRHAYVLDDAIRRWMAGLGMKEGDIRVRHFAFPEWHIGTAEWPLGAFEEVAALAAAGEPLEDEFQIKWKEEGFWVLHWHREHWMSADGDIEAT